MYLIYKNLSAYVNLGDQLTENVYLSEQSLLSTPRDIENNHFRFVGSITRVNIWSRILDFEQEIPIIVQYCQNSPVH